jgi:hypothetical protein
MRGRTVHVYWDLDRNDGSLAWRICYPRACRHVSRRLTSFVPPPHRPRMGAVTPGHACLTASFATRKSRVQIPSAARFRLVLAGGDFTIHFPVRGGCSALAYHRGSTAVAYFKGLDAARSSTCSLLTPTRSKRFGRLGVCSRRSPTPAEGQRSVRWGRGHRRLGCDPGWIARPRIGPQGVAEPGESHAAWPPPAPQRTRVGEGGPWPNRLYVAFMPIAVGKTGSTGSNRSPSKGLVLVGA